MSGLLYRYVFVCVCIMGLQPNELTEKVEFSFIKLYIVRYIYILSMHSFFLFLIRLFFSFFFPPSVKRKMSSKLVGKGQASGSAKAENSLLHVAFYLVKLPPNQGQRSVMR